MPSDVSMTSMALGAGFLPHDGTASSRHERAS